LIGPHVGNPPKSYDFRKSCRISNKFRNTIFYSKESYINLSYTIIKSFEIFQRYIFFHTSPFFQTIQARGGRGAWGRRQKTLAEHVKAWLGQAPPENPNFSPRKTKTRRARQRASPLHPPVRHGRSDRAERDETQTERASRRAARRWCRTRSWWSGCGRCCGRPTSTPPPPPSCAAASRRTSASTSPTRSSSSASRSTSSSPRSPARPSRRRRRCPRRRSPRPGRRQRVESQGALKGRGKKRRRKRKRRRRRRRRKTVAAAGRSGANTDGKRKGGGFTKLCSISPTLQEFVGASELARTEVVKKLWAYIRENNLQDPSNKRKILCDERLKKIFNVNSIDMFQMNKALTKHIWPLNSDGPVTSASPERSTPKEKPQKRERNEGKKQKGGSSGSGSGFLVPLQLSDDLVKFIGTGESMLSRSDVVKRMWDYIKENKLQDPSDRRKIICDEKLKDLLQVESFNGFTVSKLLAPHFTKTK
ncbi:Os03g0764450, partial [Oryza sativa Japonica Group]